MQELTEAEDKSGGNKPKCELEDRRYIIANFFLFLFLVVVMILVLVITGLEWPIKRKGRITVDNKTGKACYGTHDHPPVPCIPTCMTAAVRTRSRLTGSSGTEYLK